MSKQQKNDGLQRYHFNYENYLADWFAAYGEDATVDLADGTTIRRLTLEQFNTHVDRVVDAYARANAAETWKAAEEIYKTVWDSETALLM